MKDRQERRRKRRLLNPREEREKKKEKKKREEKKSLEPGIDLHVPQFNSDFHMIQSSNKIQNGDRTGKGKG